MFVEQIVIKINTFSYFQIGTAAIAEFVINCVKDKMAEREVSEKKSDQQDQKDAIKKQLFEKMQMKDRKKKKLPQDIPGSNAVSLHVNVSFYWSNHEDSRYKTIGKKDYGGARDARINKNWEKDRMIEEAKKIYFEDGISTKGPIDSFVFDMSLDAKGLKILPDGETVEKTISRTRFKNPRYYLLSKLKGQPDDSDDGMASFSPAKRRKNRSSANTTQIVTIAEATEELPELSTSCKVTTQENLSSQCDIIAMGDGGNIILLAAEQSNIFPNFDDKTIDMNNILFDEVGDDVHRPEEIIFESLHTGEEKLITIRRVNIFDEVIQYFMDEGNGIRSRYSVQMVLPDGNLEVAEDGGGVFRDFLVEFWGTFKKRYTEGCSVCVPYINQLMGEREWKAMAKLFVIGYRQEGYLPIFLAPAFMLVVLSEDKPSDEVLMSSFLSFVEDIDGTVLREGLKDFDTADHDEILSILSSYGCRTQITETNVKQVILQIAHKTLIQAPSFITKCWSPFLRKHLPPFDVQAEVEKLQPTTRKVLGILNFPPEAESEHRTTADYVRKFVKCLSQEDLEKFLRYCTGKI